MKKVDEIKKFLLDNPDRLDGKYADTAKMFGTNYEQIRSIARRIRGTCKGRGKTCLEKH